MHYDVSLFFFTGPKSYRYTMYNVFPTLSKIRTAYYSLQRHLFSVSSIIFLSNIIDLSFPITLRFFQTRTKTKTYLTVDIVVPHNFAVLWLAT